MDRLWIGDFPGSWWSSCDVVLFGLTDMCNDEYEMGRRLRWERNYVGNIGKRIF